LTNLISLNLRYNEITEIKGLNSLIKLERLNLEYNLITKIKGLENLINLGYISLGQLNNLIPYDLLREIGGDQWYHAGQKFVAYCKQKKEKYN